MLNPPLYIEVTEAGSGDSISIMLSRIHQIFKPNDSSLTMIRTFLEYGVLTPQGISMGYQDLRCRESRAEIEKKMKQALYDFRDMMQKALGEFENRASDDDPYHLFH